MADNVLRYYVRDTVVPFEEDATHEFKGHTNLCIEDIPPWTKIEGTEKRTRATVSKVLNAFLNTGTGGTTYLGILDDGLVKGISQTQYQQDHFLIALEDLFSRYTPPVDEHRYKVNFVPVVDAGMSEEEKRKVVTFDQKQLCDPMKRKTDHLLRTYRYCWCDKEAQSRFHNGFISPCYIIEIEIKPWDPSDARNHNAVGQMKCHPIHQDETERALFRRESSNVEYTMQEIYDWSQKMVDEKYGPEIERLKKERERLRALLANR